MVRRRTTTSVRDVAALAGVSVGTVSNVVNAPQLVSEQTRERVESAIEKLGWVRNESARQLRAGRSRSIGLVVIDLANPFFTDIALGVEDAVTQHGFIVQVGNSAEDPGREQTQLDLFEQQRVRGVLLAPVAEVGDRVAQLRRRGIPVVVVDRYGESSGTCSVSVDDVEGGRLAGEHLLERGHRRLAFVGGPGHLQQVRDRRLGLETAVAVDGDVSMLVVSTPRLDVDSGVRAAGELASLPDRERPTAAFAANDLVAIGLLQGFVTHGLRVPQDMAIIGYDDIAFAAAAAVPLSSIRQPRRSLGQRAAELLFDEIEAAESEPAGEHEHQHVTFTPTLVVRRSTTPGTARRPS